MQFKIGLGVAAGIALTCGLAPLVWSGDEGGTDGAGATRRFGVDLAGSYNPVPWLRFDTTRSPRRATSSSI
jgi:hypothetical protein